MNPKAKKIIKISINVILWAFLISVTALVVTVFIAKIENAELPQLGDNYYMTVASESMTGTFNKGDVIIVESYDGKDKNSFVEGDVITFYCTVDGERIINSHRIISYEDIEGVRYYTTKGDNNALQDSYKTVSSNIIGKWTGRKISGLGSIISFLQSTLGFILCIILPMSAILIYQLVVFIKTLIAYKNRNKVILTEDELKEQEELIKQKAIEEYLLRQKQREEENKEE